MNSGKRLFILGLDCATPQFVFDQFKPHLKNLSKLMNKGVYANLKSTKPPITVPAWTTMFTGKDPGQLGFYGFRNRKNYSYDELYFANAQFIKEKTVWNYFSRNRLTSIVFGVPQTYPPKPLDGIMVGCFLTPSKEVSYTYPDEIKYELDQIADGDYIIDVKDFRTDDKDDLLNRLYEMMHKRFKVIRNFIQNKPWDFFVAVEMAIDRLHHGFWRFSDKNHRLYEPGNKYANIMLDFYRAVDNEIGTLLEILDDNVDLMIVSDHGAKTMVGGICVNEWLQKEGYLTLKEPVSSPKKLKTDMIDWSKTKAWGEGGYYSRIFMNVEGREPQGIIPVAKYEQERTELAAKLEAITDLQGNNIGTKAFRPQDIYRQCNNIPPDLIIYFGDLNWRSVGSVGFGSIHTFENDTGPDDANHAEEGIFIYSSKTLPKYLQGKKLTLLDIMDVTPTLLHYFGIEIPSDLEGHIIDAVALST